MIGLFLSCEKPENESVSKSVLVTINTELKAITETSVISVVKVITNSDIPITLKGVCWEEGDDLIPITYIYGKYNDSVIRINANTRTTNYLGYVIGLKPKTNYHIKVYATYRDNSKINISYSETLSFITNM